MRLTFGSGRQWFYKHHTMHVAAWLMDFVRDLNGVGGIGLHTRPIIACAGYGWDSAVVARPCVDAAEVDRYFTRVGMWLRLMQMLGGNDLHAKNLIAVGDHPVPIDHENLFQPARRRSPRSPRRAGWRHSRRGGTAAPCRYASAR